MVPTAALKSKFRFAAMDAGVEPSVYDELDLDVLDTIPRLRSAVHVCFYDHDEKDDFEQASEADNGLACHRTCSEPDPMTLENVDGGEKRFYD